MDRTQTLGLSTRHILLPLLAGAALLAAIAGPLPSARADDYCDTSEAVACIPMPTDSGTTSPSSAGQNAAAAAGAGPRIAAVPVPAPCSIPPLTGASPAGQNAPNFVSPANPCVPYSNCLSPLAAAPDQSSPTSSAVVPIPALCSPYRGIYATINLGNSADVRALRTVSTTGLRNYWRQSALQTLDDEVAQLQAADMYATPRLYSIQVLDSTVNYVDETAVVHTMEHWLYQQYSSDDGSTIVSQDEWVKNEYDLSLLGQSWYITGNTTTLTLGPVPVPAAGG